MKNKLTKDEYIREVEKLVGIPANVVVVECDCGFEGCNGWRLEFVETVCPRATHADSDPGKSRNCPLI